MQRGGGSWFGISTRSVGQSLGIVSDRILGSWPTTPHTITHLSHTHAHTHHAHTHGSTTDRPHTHARTAGPWSSGSRAGLRSVAGTGQQLLLSHHRTGPPDPQPARAPSTCYHNRKNRDFAGPAALTASSESLDFISSHLSHLTGS